MCFPSSFPLFLWNLVLISKQCSPAEASGGVVETLLELILFEAYRLQQSSEPDFSNDNTSESQHLDSPAETIGQVVEGADYNSVNNADRKRLLDFSMRLLRNWEYNKDKVLLLCHQRRFYEGCLFLWEQKKRYDLILEHYAAQNSAQQVMLTCQRFGDEMPDLWMMALQFFSDKTANKSELALVVNELSERRLASPLQIIQQLVKVDPNRCCTLGTIKTYLVNYLNEGQELIKKNRAEVQRLSEETARNREVVRRLATQVKVFQQQKCTLCHQNLELPSIHFLCDHSYHKSCLDNYAAGNQKCPECLPRNRRLLNDIGDYHESIQSGRIGIDSGLGTGLSSHEPNSNSFRLFMQLHNSVTSSQAARSDATSTPKSIVDVKASTAALSTIANQSENSAILSNEVVPDWQDKGVLKLLNKSAPIDLGGKYQGEVLSHLLASGAMLPKAFEPSLEERPTQLSSRQPVASLSDTTKLPANLNRPSNHSAVSANLNYQGPPDSGISLSGLSEVEPGTKASIASQQSYITHTSSGPSANSITTHPPGAHRNLGTGPPVLGGMSTGYFSATPERNLSSSSSLVSGRSADTKTAIAATSGSASALITDLAITELRHPANPFDDDTGDSLFPTCVDSADEALLPGNPFGDEALGHSPPQTTKQSRSPPLLNPFD